MSPIKGKGQGGEAQRGMRPKLAPTKTLGCSMRGRRSLAMTQNADPAANERASARLLLWARGSSVKRSVSLVCIQASSEQRGIVVRT